MGRITRTGVDMKVRIYYEDTDAGGVVYHANYLRYFERARTEYLRDRGVSVSELAANGHILPVVRVEIDYRTPAVYDDLLDIETEVLEVGKSSFSVGQRALRDRDRKLLVECKVTLVSVNEKMRPHRLPDALLRGLRN
jgi:acyl-CoA thioester hydrolase